MLFQESPGGILLDDEIEMGFMGIGLGIGLGIGVVLAVIVVCKAPDRTPYFGPRGLLAPRDAFSDRRNHFLSAEAY